MSQTQSDLGEEFQFQVSDDKWCVIDAADAALVQRYSWRWTYNSKSRGTGYVVTTTKKPSGGYATVSLHRLLLDPPKDKHVDHINGDRLDNRRSNLRLASRSQNMANMRKRTAATSQYKGVCWNADRGRWQANIYLNGKSLHLGMFDDEALAALAYDRAALDAHKEFAATNFPRVIVDLASPLFPHNGPVDQR